MPNKSTFTDLFPVPRFLDMPSVGFSLSDNHIRFVELKNQKGNRVPVRWAEIKLPKGLIKGGEIIEKEKLINELRKAQKQYKLKFIKASLPEEKTYLFKTELPITPHMDIEEAVSLRLEDNVPIKKNEVIFGYDFLPHLNSKLHLNVHVIPRTTVNKYLEIFLRAGLVPVSFEIESHASTRAFSDTKNPKTFLSISLGDEQTVLSIVSLGFNHLNSTLPVGSQMIDKKIIELKKCTPEEAKKIRLTTLPDETLKETYEKYYEEVKNNALKLIQYWNNYRQEKKIKKTNGEETPSGEQEVSGIIFLGGNALMPNLQKKLVGEIGLHSKVASVWANCFDFEDYIPPISFRNSLSYSTAIGLCLS